MQYHVPSCMSSVCIYVSLCVSLHRVSFMCMSLCPQCVCFSVCMSHLCACVLHVHAPSCAGLPCVCPSVSMSPLCDVSFVCMFPMSLRHSMHMSLREYVSSWVCLFMWMSLLVYILPRMSLRAHVFFMCKSLYVPCLRMLLRVHVPSCVCPFVCMLLPVSLFMGMFFRAYVPFVRMSPSCACTLMCMSLHVYVLPCV